MTLVRHEYITPNEVSVHPKVMQLKVKLSRMQMWVLLNFVER